MLHFDRFFLAPEVQKFVVLGVCIVDLVYCAQFIASSLTKILSDNVLTSFFFKPEVQKVVVPRTVCCAQFIARSLTKNLSNDAEYLSFETCIGNRKCKSRLACVAHRLTHAV